ncbi:MAG TPA: PilC/PilY family type IV pilus protein [Gammaproteobacteria bacterium]
MKTCTNGMFHFLLAFFACMATTLEPLHADELSELYLNSSNSGTGSAIGPNILIILDTSGSMTKHGVSELGFEVDPEIYWGEAYDPTRTYPGPCDPAIAYRKSFGTDRDGDGDVDLDDATDADFQECDNGINFPMTTMACKAVIENGAAVDRFGEFRPNTPGPNSDHMFNGEELDGEWESLDSSFNGVATIDGQTVWRECASDFGIHGRSDSDSNIYPKDWDYAWTSSPYGTKNLSGETSQLVANGNYINYYRWSQTRLAAVQAALREVIAELPPSTRVGVMRFDVGAGDSTDGGYMIQEFVELGENTVDASGNVIVSPNRLAIIDRIHEIDPADDGATPLGETLFEALRVYRGDRVHFGADAETWNIDTNVWPWDDNMTTYVNVSSVPGSRDPADMTRYKSPVIYECQKSAVIFLSDGDPTSDTSTDEDFAALPNAAAYGAVDCDDASSTDSCLREVADYLAHEDLSPLTGKQTVTTYTVGFGTDISSGGTALLSEAATRGGGTYTPADNYDTLKSAFQVIFRKEIASNQSLSSPAVTVNAFNRLAHEDSLYFTMFDPILDSVHWPGNVKKYRLAQQTDGSYRIVDANNQPALNDGSSAIRYDALSYWTDTTDPLIVANGGADGDQTELGGAAAAFGYYNQPYSWYGDEFNKELSDSANWFTSANVTNEMVGLDPGAAFSERHHIFNHVIGFDADDQDSDGIVSEPTLRMGAAPHGIPAVVNYGADAASATQVIFTPTNDGFLHAIDAATGADLWSFIPTETMSRLADIYHPPTDSYIGYGLDGSVIYHAEEINGVEKKWIFFGMRRGGRSIYALDVTDKLAPKLMWRIRGGVDSGFTRLGQTWSEPRVAHINVGGTATTVLVFGGGYDTTTQDGAAATSGYVDDTIANSLYMVKAEDGTLLWSAGSGGDLVLPDMKSSIAASVEIKDKNNDGFDDLIYAADLGGRIFRFDIDNSASSATPAVTGGMIASLGGTSLADNRKFFNEPDVVLAAKDGQGYWAINIGSGDRERPKSNMTTQNYLFSIKDPHIFEAPSDYNYGITIDDLYDATANDIQSEDATEVAAARTALLQSKGWMVALGHAGEKALARATTFDFRVFFTTFDPTPLNSTSCNSQPGTARLYSMDLLTAGAVGGDVNNDNTITATDRETTLTHGTIPPPVTIMFVAGADGSIEATSIIGRSDDNADLGDTGVVRRTFWNVHGKDETEQ